VAVVFPRDDAEIFVYRYFFLGSATFSSSQAMFCPRVFMACNPSSSFQHIADIHTHA